MRESLFFCFGKRGRAREKVSIEQKKARGCFPRRKKSISKEGSDAPNRYTMRKLASSNVQNGAWPTISWRGRRSERDGSGFDISRPPPLLKKYHHRTWKLNAFAPPPDKYGLSTLSMTGMMTPRSQSAGRKSRATKSSTREAQSRFARWMVAETMASRSGSGTSATRPKSSRQSLPASGPAVTLSRLPVEARDEREKEEQGERKREEGGRWG